MARILLSQCSVAVSVMVGSSVASASDVRAQRAEVMLPKPVQTALQENAEGLSPITVSWSHHFQTQLSPYEALSRLNIDDHKDRFFFRSSRRVMWQDGKIYIKWKRPILKNHVVLASDDEDASDGKVFYGGSRDSVRQVLFKRYMSQVIKDEPHATYLDSVYFPAVGIRTPRKMVEWKTPRATSEVLYLLEQGGTLRSIEEVVLEGRELLRIAIIGANPILKGEALKIDSPARRREDNRESPDNIQQRQGIPAERRFVYYLDQALHYAVRRWEQWYEPDTLLRKCECSGFQKIPGRELWLPQRCEIQYFEFDSVPGTLFNEPILSEQFDVSEFDVTAVPDSQFQLDYTSPGTRVRDATLPEAAANPDGFITYTIPENLMDLDRVIEMARKGQPADGRVRRHVPLVIILNAVVLTIIALIYYYSKKIRMRTGK